MPADGIHNAVINKAHLGLEDHGIMTAYLDINYGGSFQGFGGWDLRRPAALGTFVMGVLKVVDVPSWDRLVGKPIRVKVENGLVKKIGHYLHDRWFDPREALTSP